VQNCPLREGPHERSALHNGLARTPARWPSLGQSRAGLGVWPVAFDVGPSQTLSRRCGANTEGARTEAPGVVGPACLWPGER